MLQKLDTNERECYVVPRFGAAIGSGGVGLGFACH